MAEIDRLNRAGVRRLLALYSDGRRLALRDTLVSLAGPLPLAEIEARFLAYLVDPLDRPLRGGADDAWLARSLLLAPIAPGSALPLGDDIAAIVAAPRLVEDGRIATEVREARFARHADAAIAAAVAQLAPEPALEAVVQLAADEGPDEHRLHLALLQAGTALAWRPALAGVEATTWIVDALLGLLDRASPRPLLDTLAPILGAIGAVSPRVRDAVRARLRGARGKILDRRTGSSFLGEFQALDRPRVLPDEDHYATLPDRNVAEAAARILGRAVEDLDGPGFVALQREVLEGDFGTTLLPAFVDGVVAATTVSPLAELVRHLLSSPDHEQQIVALGIAARIPLGDCAGEVLACTEDERTPVRIAAVRALPMLDPELAVPVLIARLDDPDPEVCAVAARALVDAGQRDRVAERRMPGEPAIGKSRARGAVARAAIGDIDGDVIGVLVALAAGEAEHNEEGADQPFVAALGAALRASADGIHLTASIARDVPEALPIVALALATDAPATELPAPLRAELAAALEPLIAAGGDTGMVALELLARFSLGDEDMVERILDAGAANPGYAGQILASLAHVRVSTERAAEALAPLLADRDHLAAAVMAAAVAGAVLPFDHPAWAQVRDLSELGTVAAAAAHAALVTRARVG